MELRVQKREIAQQEKSSRTVREKDPLPNYRIPEVGTIAGTRRRKRRAAWHLDNWNPAFVVIGFVILFAALTAILLYLNPA